MTTTKTILDTPGYDSLAHVLKRAFDQASKGKGKERHANDLPFDQQPMQQIARRRGVGFLLGQADKKSEEAMILPPGRDVAELLGAMVYLAGAIIFLEAQRNAAHQSELEQHEGDAAATDVSPHCSRSGDKTRPLCGECKPYGTCCGI